MEAYILVIKTNTNFIFIFNKSEAPLLILKNSKLGRIHDLYKNNLVNFYLTSPKDFQLAKGLSY